MVRSFSVVVDGDFFIVSVVVVVILLEIEDSDSFTYFNLEVLT